MTLSRPDPATDQPAEPAGDGDETIKPQSPASEEISSGVQPGKELVVIQTDTKTESWVTRWLIRLGLRSGATLRDDLTEALTGEGEGGDQFSPEERAMLQNILRLRERRVVDVMVPRVEIQAVDETITLGEVLLEFEESGHSRLPVYKETLDDPRGMVLIKDLLLHMTKRAAEPPPKTRKPARKSAKTKKAATTPTKQAPEGIELDMNRINLSMQLKDMDVIRRVLFVPPSMLASDLMARMQATRTQMALVIDEYGGTDGLVSLEDIVEEVVGEIEDEHDDDEADARITLTSDGVWKVDARVELERLQEEIGTAFDPGEKAEDMDTLGGLVFALAGHVPVRGEVVTGVPGFEFRVLDADPRRIRTVQLVQTSLRDKRRKLAAGHGASSSRAVTDKAANDG
ncbi:MAG: hemolysin family protein [Pseudomonadota bacterium]